MARIRSVKPDFFLSERVASVSIQARLFFIGLFCHMDRDGRAEWSARRMKAQIFPYDDVDTHALMAELVDAGLVRVYRAGEGWACDLPGFAEHQRPHPKEAASVVPACPDDWRNQIGPWKNTASREKPGSIPSSYAGSGSGKEISDLGREGDLGSGSGSHNAPASAETPSQAKRIGYADPHGFRRDPSAAAYALVSEQQQIAIPGQWWERARKDRGLAFDAVDAFAAWLAEQVRGGLVVGARKLQWLDEQLSAWQDSLRPEPVLYPDAADVMRRHALPPGEELGTLPPGGVKQLIRELKAGRG